MRRGWSRGNVSPSKRPEHALRSLIYRAVLSSLLVEEADGNSKDRDDNLGLPVTETGGNGSDIEDEEPDETDELFICAFLDERSFSWRKYTNAGSSCTDEKPVSSLTKSLETHRKRSIPDQKNKSWSGAECS